MRRAVLGLSAAIAAFLVLLVDVTRVGVSAPIDSAVSTWGRAEISPWVRDDLARDLLSLLGDDLLLWPIAIASALALWVWRERAAAVVLVVTALAGVLSVFALKEMIARERPSGPSQSFAFPSGHTTDATLFWGLAGVLVSRALARRGRDVRRLAIALAVTLAFIVGAARVLAGVHWVTDVAGGWALGAAWIFAALLALDLWEARVSGRRGAQRASAS